MVGLADIPCVGKFMERISENTVDAVFRGLRYMFCYKALVDQLNSETEKLNIEKDKMSRKIKEEKNNGKLIENYVLKWQDDVEEIQRSAKEFSPSYSCIQRLPIPNPVSRFRLGKNAAKKAQTVTKLTFSGKDYLSGRIAHLPPVKNIPKSGTRFEEFPSRKDAYGKLWDALVTEDSPLIHGIYGMAGVGKTRMMEHIWEDAMKKNIFDKVVRVNVGNENLKEINLQDQVAGCLNCKLESQDVESRASQLENSLRNGGKILLILDDVWREIRLDNIIGTSFNDGSSSKGSKILLTSREKDVCLLNKCKHLVEIKTLSPDEALYLFKNTVGPDTINPLLDESLVRKVCDECGQLPLLIHAVGKALEGKPHISWKDAHDQLKKGKFEKIAGVDPQVFAGIKLSIDKLKDDDAKSCLFLCSLFPEDAIIHEDILIQLATGSQLIPDGESRILAMVHQLKISSLLLSGKYNETKVHDIIRDVARSIAFTDSKYAFLQVTCNSRYLPSNANYCTRKFLRLDAETDDVHFYENPVCPDLHTLWLQGNYHPQLFLGGFFRMFVNLSFLMLQNVKIYLEQFSLQPLGNLRTLSLLNCDISKTDVSLFPKNLKTLCICYCHLPRPLDVANLKYLQKLEIQQFEPKLVMVSNVISSLSSLEELHIPNGFIIDGEEYHTEPIVMEISKLTHLTSVDFHFSNDNNFLGTNIFSNIDRYNISVCELEEFDHWVRHWGDSSMRSIELDGNHLQSWEGLMGRAEEVRLRYSDVKVSSICNGHKSTFEDLKRLYIKHCDNMGHLASISQDDIQYSLQPAKCFSQLTILDISRCSKLKYLFCNNIAKSLVQLQELSVYSCDSMEAIIMNKGTSDGEIINFSKLKLLKIGNMSRLASFYGEKKNLHSVSTLSMDPSDQYHPLFDGMVALPSLEKLEIENLSDISVIWGKDCYTDTVSSFCKLNDLNVYGCDKLESVIPPSVASDLTHLKKISVERCEEMREIVEAGEQVITDGTLFPDLTDLYLFDLPNLMSFWCYQSGKANTCKVPLTLPRLSKIILQGLPALKRLFHGANSEFRVHGSGFSNTLFTRSVFRNLRQLEELSVFDCELLEGIFEDARGDETLDTSDEIITLNRLSMVHLQGLPKFKSIFCGATYKCYMPALKNVKIVGCGLSILFTCSVFQEIRQLEKLHVSNCESLEHIVKEVGGDETSEIEGKSIISSQLSSITLESLPNLKSFSCTSSYVFNMPKLQNYRLIKCPQIEYFGSSKTNTSLVRTCY